MTANDPNLDPLARMRAANPVSATELREALSDEELARLMRQAIAAGQAGDVAPRSVGFAFRRRATTLAVGVALACIAAVAALALFGGLPGTGRGGPSFAAAAIEVAEANPRLLVTEPGWSVTRADEFNAESGEITFSDGSHDLDVVWYPARFYGGYLRDRANVSTPTRSTLLGGVATTVDYGREEYATMLAPQGRVFVEIRGRLGSKARYDAVLRSLRPVDVDSWLAAMPPSAVTPSNRAAAVEKVLRGVPLPPGFDLSALEASEAVREPYQLTVEVTGAVACGWVESWIAARRSGEAGKAAAAVEAMSSWEHWPALQSKQMRRGWAQNIRQTAKRLAHDHLGFGPAGIEVRADGRAFEYGPQWSLALGCKPHYRRPAGRR